MIAFFFFLWVAGFIFSFVAGYIFLRLANAKKRVAGTAVSLRFAAAAVAMAFAYAWSFDGLNVGSVIATCVILGMIMFRKRHA